MSRRSRLFLIVTTIGAFIIGFIFAWNVFNSTPSSVDPNSVRVESTPAQGEVTSAQDDDEVVGEESVNAVDEFGSGTGPAVVADAGRDDLLPGAECAGLHGRFVGVHDGYVAIFAGTPDGCSELIETRPQQVAQLLPFQLDDLLRGVVFQDDDELFQILEGLVAP